MQLCNTLMIGFPSTEMIDLWHIAVLFFCYDSLFVTQRSGPRLYRVSDSIMKCLITEWHMFESHLNWYITLVSRCSEWRPASLQHHRVCIINSLLLDLPWIMQVFQEKSKLCPAVGCCEDPHSTLLHFPPFPHPHLRGEVREHLVSTLDPDVSCSLPISVSKVRLCV